MPEYVSSSLFNVWKLYLCNCYGAHALRCNSPVTIYGRVVNTYGDICVQWQWSLTNTKPLYAIGNVIINQYKLWKVLWWLLWLNWKLQRKNIYIVHILSCHSSYYVTSCLRYYMFKSFVFLVLTRRKMMEYFQCNCSP